MKRSEKKNQITNEKHEIGNEMTERETEKVITEKYSNTPKKRKGYLDIAKAIGVIIVLINHIGLSLGKGNTYLGAFYVSEFFLLAGMTFYIKPEETADSFMTKKAKRLLIPYFGYSTFYLLWYGMSQMRSGHFNALDIQRKIAGICYGRNFFNIGTHRIYMMEIMNAPMWFLLALFSCLVMYGILTILMKDKKWIGVVLLTGFGIVLQYTVKMLLPWGIDVAMIMLPLMYVGERLAKVDYIGITRRKIWLLPLIAFLFVGVVTWNGPGNSSVNDYGHSVLLFLTASFCGTSLCVIFSYYVETYLHFLAKPLMIVGRYTMEILCLHLFVFAIVSTIAGILGAGSENTGVKIVAVFLGLAVPVLLKSMWIRILDMLKKGKNNE